MHPRPILILVFLCIATCGGLARAAETRLYAICGAYAPEMTALKEGVGVDPAQGWERRVIKGVEFWRGSSGGKELVLFRTGISLVNAAYQLQLALDHFPITHILFAGVAGGTDPALQVGDVVVPSRWAYHGEAAYLNEDPANPGKYLIPDYLKPRYENFGMIFPDDTAVIREGQAAFEDMAAFPADPALLAAAERALPKLPPMVKRGRTVAVQVGGTGVAGQVFLDNARYREWVFRVWQARCVDMESTALAHVAYVNRTPILIIRGLSDLAGGQAGKNPIDENEDAVSMIAVKVLRGVLAEL